MSISRSRQQIFLLLSSIVTPRRHWQCSTGWTWTPRSHPRRRRRKSSGSRRTTSREGACVFRVGERLIFKYVNLYGTRGCRCVRIFAWIFRLHISFIAPNRLSWWQKTKPKIWSMFDEPYSSSAAKVRKVFLKNRFCHVPLDYTTTFAWKKGGFRVCVSPRSA